MDPTRIEQYAQDLYKADLSRIPIEPLSARHATFSIGDAYAVQTAFIEKKLSQGGTIIGKKIGLTSKPIQTLFNVHEPDYGRLLSSMYVFEQDLVPLSQCIQPKVEGELALVLERDLDMEFVTEADVLRSVAFVVPAIEIIDSRIQNWNVGITDTIADNASSGMFVIGGKKTLLGNLDTRTLGMTLEHNGSIAVTGAGAAALGSPIKSAAWLANTLHNQGVGLHAGEIILTGALAGTVIPHPGDSVRVTIQKLGAVSVRFSA